MRRQTDQVAGCSGTEESLRSRSALPKNDWALFYSRLSNEEIKEGVSELLKKCHAATVAAAVAIVETPEAARSKDKDLWPTFLRFGG